MARVASALGALLLAGLPRGASSQQPNAAVVLRWKEVPRAETYQIEIAEDLEFRVPLLSEQVPTAGYRWAEIPASRYYWRVRAIDSQGRTGSWSEVRTIEPALIPPELIAPSDGARLSAEGSSRSVDLACSGSPVVKRYAVEVASDPEFRTVVARAAGPSPRLRVKLGVGSFYWHMRATSLTGRETPASRPRRFSVATRKPAEVASEPAPAESPEPVLPPGAGAPEAAGPPIEVAVAMVVPPPPALPPAEPPAAPPAGPEDGNTGPGLPGTGPSPSARAGALQGGIQVGWFNNFRHTSTPWVSLEAQWRPGVLSERLLLSARAGYYSVHAEVPAPTSSPEASAQVSPVAVLGLYAIPAGEITFHAGAGPCVYLVRASVGDESATYLAAGGQVLFGVGLELGPGTLSAESSLFLGSVDRPLARLRTGGALFSLGYRWGP